MEATLATLEAQYESLLSQIHAFNNARPTSPGGGGTTSGGAAAQRSSQLSKPDPKFEGCWHCGKKHPGGRRQCRLFKALIQKHKGIPKGYDPFILYSGEPLGTVQVTVFHSWPR